MNLQSTLLDFFSRPELQSSRPLLVAFSGGTDSTALLAALATLRGEGKLCTGGLIAAHLDHAGDAGSSDRAARARGMAEALGVSFLGGRREVAARRRSGESWESAARRVRYEFLEEVRQECGAGWVALAHHRDDQAETVLLRWLLGSNLPGLGAMRPIHGVKIRPLLRLAKFELSAYLEARGLSPQEDPTNRDLGALRNRIRHRLLPALAEAEQLPDLSSRLSRLAERSHEATAAIFRRLFEIFPGLESPEPFLDREALLRLPAELRPFALSALHRSSGIPLPPSHRAIAAILRELERPGGAERAGADLGLGRRWRLDKDRLWIERARPAEPANPAGVSGFTYTFSAPGRIEVPEADVALILHRTEFASWMLRGDPHRAGLALPSATRIVVEVRNRRPGDRLRPLGAPGSRKLKELLIDRRIDRTRRDTLPLLCVGGAIAWVPGIAIDDRFRVRGPEDPVWIAEIEPLPHASQPFSTGRSAAAGNPRAQGAVTPMEREPHALASEVAEL